MKEDGVVRDVRSAGAGEAFPLREMPPISPTRSIAVTMKPHLLYLSEIPPWPAPLSGAQLRTARLVEQLSRTFRVTMLCSNDPGGRPSRVPGAERVDDEHALFANEPAEFASACLRLLRDDALAQRMVSAGREWVQRYGAWNRSGDAAIALVTQLLKAP